MNAERWHQVRSVVEAALPLDSAERNSYLDRACATDQSLRHEVESLLAADEQAQSNFLRSPLTVNSEELQRERASWIGRRIGSYQITGMIGEGGMGAVYRAVRADEQYQKQVAIKVVKRGLAMPFALARFRAERQILANLEHPNIARLVDGGTAEDGNPYVVMELVEGQPIDKFCAARGLSIEERLRLFRTVCLAVQYAHQHLVVHRDLKPGNLLVTAEGIPKLLDFGIAKILDTGSVSEGGETTVSLARLLTPEYASPEQVRGETVTTASDVYSLGVILFLLLTGRFPYRFENRSTDAIIRAVCDTEPPKPSVAAEMMAAAFTDGYGNEPHVVNPVAAAKDFSLKRRRRLQGDLDNIVLMALRKDPRRRYASAEQFAEDIRRHLEGLPVIARTDTFGYRASKFIKRHRVGVTAVAAIILALAAGMTTTLREARIAMAQSKKAQRRFQDVRALANSLIFDVHDSIQDLPGSTPARKLIVEKALQYLDGLAVESQDDPSLQRELAAAYRRIGDVQGYEFNANLGDTAASLRSYEKVLAIRTALWSSNRGSVADSLDLAESLRLVSQTEMLVNQLSAALENSQKAVELMEPVEKANPKDAAVVLELLVDYQAVANILGGGNLCNVGNNRVATEFRRKQLATAERVADLLPTDPRGQGNLAIALYGLAEQLYQGGERVAALDNLSRARTIFANLAEHSQKRARALYLMNVVSDSIASAELSNGQLSQALATARVTAQIAETLSRDDPSDVQAGTSLATAYVTLADLELRSGNAKSASSHIKKANSLVTRFVGSNTIDTEGRARLAELYLVTGDQESLSGDGRRALKSYAAASKIFAQVQSENSSNVGAREHLAATYNKVGRVQTNLRDFEAAAATFIHARELADVEGALANANAQALYTMADSDTGLGEIEATLAADARHDENSRIEHLRKAITFYERSLATWSQIKEPGMFSPDGFEAVLPALVNERLSRAKAALLRRTAPASVSRAAVSRQISP